MKVAITGSEGMVGQALIGQLDAEQFQITPIDLPKYDCTDFEGLIEATKGHDAVIHLAWKGLDVDHVHPDNGVMYENVYRAAVANKIGLVIMGSSNHARDYSQREADGKIRYTGQSELANNIYGVEKQKMEAMGKYFAAKELLKVLCVRIGNINPEDKPRPATPTRWMSHHDFGRMMTMALQHNFEPGHFEVVYGVSKQEVFDWVNSFGFEPADSAE